MNKLEERRIESEIDRNEAIERMAGRLQNWADNFDLGILKICESLDKIAEALSKKE